MWQNTHNYGLWDAKDFNQCSADMISESIYHNSSFWILILYKKGQSSRICSRQACLHHKLARKGILAQITKQEIITKEAESK
jgi:hypothetical protein